MSNVLDRGFVRLIDHMGTDLTVVNAARVSFGKKKKELDEKDERLIAYLAKHNHWTPFGHPMVTLHMKMPIFVARQWMRSNVGIVYNEVSRRYVDDPPEFYYPEKWRKRPDKSIKQGSGEDIDPESAVGEECFDKHYVNCHSAMQTYYSLLENNVSPEMARMVLPQNLYTELWMTCSIAAAARMYLLRADSHAQWEIQEYARGLAREVEPRFPVSWKALTGFENSKGHEL